MTKRYSEEFKESAIKKMMPPNSVSVRQLSGELGVSDVTLYKWRKNYRNRGVAVPSDQTKPEAWTAEDKLAVVIETAALNEVELSEYCRRRGLYSEQVEQWKISALAGYKRSTQLRKDELRNRQKDKKIIKQLERQLDRKNKALAETAALLVLSKKCEAIWGVSEED